MRGNMRGGRSSSWNMPRLSLACRPVLVCATSSQSQLISKYVLLQPNTYAAPYAQPVPASQLVCMGTAQHCVCTTNSSSVKHSGNMHQCMRTPDANSVNKGYQHLNPLHIAPTVWVVTRSAHCRWVRRPASTVMQEPDNRQRPSMRSSTDKSASMHGSVQCIGSEQAGRHRLQHRQVRSVQEQDLGVPRP